MTVDFTKLLQFNKAHPTLHISTLDFLILNMLYAEDTPEEVLGAEYIQERRFLFEKGGYIKIVGEGMKDISLRDLGLELVGIPKSDSLMELSVKYRAMFPEGIRTGGYLVRSSPAEIAEKFRKFFKKHKYTHEQVLQATKNYIEQKRRNNWHMIQRAVYFIEKDGLSNLASECENLDKVSEEPKIMTITKML